MIPTPDQEEYVPINDEEDPFTVGVVYDTVINEYVVKVSLYGFATEAKANEMAQSMIDMLKTELEISERGIQ